MTRDPLAPAAAHYNVTAYYREINSSARQAYAGTPLRVGMPAPEFRLTDVDGAVVELRKLRHHGPVVLVFGCYSAPPCFEELPHIDRLLSARPDAQSLLVYTREIHPNEKLPYGRFEHHRTDQAKLATACRLREDLALTMRVVVDDLAGTTHLAYGGLPFSAVIIARDGVLVHREEWASAEQLAHVLDNLRLGDARSAEGRTPRLSLSETLWTMERLDKKP